jgi:hypothetical protein
LKIYDAAEKMTLNGAHVVLVRKLADEKIPSGEDRHLSAARPSLSEEAIIQKKHRADFHQNCQSFRLSLDLKASV